MKTSVQLMQEVEFLIPTLPKFIATTTNSSMPLDQLSVEVVDRIFETMRQNAMELVKAKKASENKKLLDEVGNSDLLASGKKLVEKIV